MIKLYTTFGMSLRTMFGWEKMLNRSIHVHEHRVSRPSMEKKGMKEERKLKQWKDDSLEWDSNMANALCMWPSSLEKKCHKRESDRSKGWVERGEERRGWNGGVLKIRPILIEVVIILHQNTTENRLREERERTPKTGSIRKQKHHLKKFMRVDA